MGLQSHTIDVGEQVKKRTKKAESFTNDYKRISDYKRIADYVVNYKAIRRVGGYLGLDVGDREIRALSTVWLWCWQFKKDGGPVSKIIDWSGYTRTWQGRMRTAIRDCLNRGLLEEVAIQGGVKLVITARGNQVLKTVELMSEIVIEEMEGKREKPKGRYHENRIREGKP